MKIALLLISLLFSPVALNPSLQQRRRNYLFENEFSFSDEEKEIQQEKKIIRHRLDVIPKRFRKRRVRLKLKCNYFETRSRDPRDSNQRLIRRKFNNM